MNDTPGDLPSEGTRIPRSSASEDFSDRSFWVGYALLLLGIALLGVDILLIVNAGGANAPEIVLLAVAALLFGAGARSLHNWHRSTDRARSGRSEADSPT
ncbi:hypothetical protein [Actinomadura kijaniata]|uniref:hypothetical protein n=1 Tax=Actinomadura kijaniata TaxID=46161 RepID=UPI00082D55AC|nr:hypothetical protein [Actinomadura kijaniata]